jgi:hypothetical protein
LQAEQDSDGSAQSTADMTAFVSTNYYCAVLHLAVLIVECRLDHICRVEPTVHLWLMVYPCSLFSGAKPSYADGKFLALFGDSLVSCACPHFFFESDYLAANQVPSYVGEHHFKEYPQIIYLFMYSRFLACKVIGIPTILF